MHRWAQCILNISVPSYYIAKYSFWAGAVCGSGDCRRKTEDILAKIVNLYVPVSTNFYYYWFKTILVTYITLKITVFSKCDKLWCNCFSFCSQLVYKWNSSNSDEMLYVSACSKLFATLSSYNFDLMQSNYLAVEFRYYKFPAKIWILLTICLEVELKVLKHFLVKIESIGRWATF